MHSGSVAPCARGMQASWPEGSPREVHQALPACLSATILSSPSPSEILPSCILRHQRLARARQVAFRCATKIPVVHCRWDFCNVDQNQKLGRSGMLAAADCRLRRLDLHCNLRYAGCAQSAIVLQICVVCDVQYSSTCVRSQRCRSATADAPCAARGTSCTRAAPEPRLSPPAGRRACAKRRRRRRPST